MKKGWITKEIDTACEVEYGTRVVRKRDGGTIYPVYGGGGATFFMDTYNREDALVVARFAMSEECTRFVEGKFFLNDSGLTVTPKNADELLPEFLNLQMLFLNDYIYSLSRGAAQRNLNVPAFRKTLINYPESLDEQHRIVSILDHCFEAIDKAKANAEQNLQNAKELFESYLQGVFESDKDGWEEKKLKDISKINYGYTEKASFEEVGPKFLRITDIQDNNVNWDTVPYCKCSNKDQPKYKLETGDIVFARTGATTGKSYLIKNPPISVFASYLIRLRMKSEKDFIPEFISYFFQTKRYWDEIKEGTSGSAQGGFNATKLGELQFPFPKSMKEQQTIVSKLDAFQEETKKLEVHYQKRIDDLEELKKSILQKAFAGELKTEKMVEETPLAPISESACPVKLKKHFIGVCCEAEKI